MIIIVVVATMPYYLQILLFDSTLYFFLQLLIQLEITTQLVHRRNSWFKGVSDHCRGLYLSISDIIDYRDAYPYIVQHFPRAPAPRQNKFVLAEKIIR